ncbi:hypothetical protein BKA67DRAFT_690333 [Truncatella angustata]|uniref:PEBP-like protein n=1 Tax=Truncatella angustata TaxID=152316 RepID=A0A9P8UNZ2_9PEZI|nr:uncharacterized protein BKA67DRAFT_690333 [Truncatella angustata]KAH6655550.1 hypothetical protein BKA67DRAFT_690333 [Truncatella angustata]
MSSTKKNTEALKEHKIIPDVLSDNVKPAYSLTLNWPNTTLESPAQELGGEETQPQPLVYLNSAWLVTNVSTTSEGYLAIPKKANVPPYVGPAPQPNYVSPRPHRYCFILAQGYGDVHVTPEDLRELQKPYIAAMEGK